MISIFFDILLFTVGVGCTLFGGIGITQILNDYWARLKMADENKIKIQSIEGEFNTKVQQMKQKDTQLIIGYENESFLKWPIIIDMAKTPHMLVTGLSNNGKTKMIEYAIRNKNVVILNADFKKDFKDFDCRKISDHKEMLEFLKETLMDETYKEQALYIVIDELLVLSNQKEISTAIMDLLAIARHRNVYIIGISQSAEKEVLKYKHLFNTRICFRMVEESSYRTVLGYTPEIRDIQQRQFLYYSDHTGMGYTYNVG
jgi:hypothetical protein